MPTVFRYKGFRFHFYSDEGHEPPHVHVRRGKDSCKFWLSPVSLAYNDGLKLREIRTAEQVVRERRDEFERAWNDYFTK